MKKIAKKFLVVFLIVALIGCNKTINNGNNNDKVLEISDNWIDLEFIIGNEKYTFPLDYQDLNDKGWQMKENEDLPAGESTFENYEMWHSDFYDETLDLYAYIYIDFHNYEDETKKIKDCDVWSIACYRIVEEISEQGYEIKLAKGIKWGSTEQEVLAAYGPVEENYRIDSGGNGWILVYYSQIESMMIQMNLHIDNEIGLYMAELMQYPVE